MYQECTVHKFLIDGEGWTRNAISSPRDCRPPYQRTSVKAVAPNRNDHLLVAAMPGFGRQGWTKALSGRQSKGTVEFITRDAGATTTCPASKSARTARSQSAPLGRA